jgi:hypothetical protein
MKAKTIAEALDFNRDQNDPLKKLGIGVGYKLWREKHDKLPLAIYKFHLVDPMKNKEIYTVSLMYKSKNGSQTGDTVYFANERLVGPTGIAFSLSNMQNKPDHMFDPAETTFWDNPEVFNKEIDKIIADPRKWVNNDLCEDWFEQPFETMMRSWFSSGVNRVEKIEFIFKG